MKRNIAGEVTDLGIILPSECRDFLCSGCLRFPWRVWWPHPMYHVFWSWFMHVFVCFSLMKWSNMRMRSLFCRWLSGLGLRRWKTFFKHMKKQINNMFKKTTNTGHGWLHISIQLSTGTGHPVTHPIQQSSVTEWDIWIGHPDVPACKYHHFLT